MIPTCMQNYVSVVQLHKLQYALEFLVTAFGCTFNPIWNEDERSSKKVGSLVY